MPLSSALSGSVCSLLCCARRAGAVAPALGPRGITLYHEEAEICMTCAAHAMMAYLVCDCKAWRQAWGQQP